MRFETVILCGVIVTYCAYFPEGAGTLSKEEARTLRKRNEEAQWLLSKAQDEKIKLKNEIEILQRRAEAPELLKRLGKFDMTRASNLPKTRGVHEGVGYSIFWESSGSSSSTGSEQNLHKNGDLQITVDEYDQSGQKISPEKRNEIKQKIEAKMMGTGNI